MYTKQELEEKLSYELIRKMFNKCPNVIHIRSLIKRENPEEMVTISKIARDPKEVKNQDKDNNKRKKSNKSKKSNDNSESNKGKKKSIPEEDPDEPGEIEQLTGEPSLHEDITVFGIREYEERDLINEIIAEAIDSILKHNSRAELNEVDENGQQINPVRNIFGYTKRIVENKICDIIKIDKEARWRWAEHKKQPPIIDWPNRPLQEKHIFSIQQREKVYEYFYLLSECEKTVVTKYVIEEEEVSVIAKQMGLSESKVSQIKHKAWKRINEAMKEAEKEEMQEDHTGLLQDISLLQETSKSARVNSISQNQSQWFNPGIQEEESMDSEYADMLLHTIHDVAQIQPISDMFDEYIMGRLIGKQKDILEEHLMKCAGCSSQLKTRKFILSALKQVLSDVGNN